MNEFVTEGLRTTKMALPRVGLRIADAHDLTRLLGGMLYGVKPWDLVVLGSVSLLLLFVALMASYFPARRATAIDPTIALRYQ